MPRSPRQDTIAKLHRTIGETGKRPVGADDSVRPWGNGKFATTYRKNGRATVRVDATPADQFRGATARSAALSAEDGHRPLQTVCGFALVHSCSRVCAAGRTGSSAPTLRQNAFQLKTYAFSSLQSPSATASLGHQGKPWVSANPNVLRKSPPAMIEKSPAFCYNTTLKTLSRRRYERGKTGHRDHG